MGVTTHSEGSETAALAVSVLLRVRRFDTARNGRGENEDGRRRRGCRHRHALSAAKHCVNRTSWRWADVQRRRDG